MKVVSVASVCLLLALPLTACSVDTTEASAEADLTKGAGFRLGTYEDYDPNVGLATHTFTSGSALYATSGVFKTTDSGGKVSTGTFSVAGGRFNMVPDDGTTPKTFQIKEYKGNDLVFEILDPTGKVLDLEIFRHVTLADGTLVDSFNCEATKLFDDTVFEEGLSVDEYPSVSIDINPYDRSLYLNVGAGIEFSRDNYEMALTKYSSSEITIAAKDASSGTFTFEVIGSKGTIYFQEDGAKLTKVARITCKRPDVKIP